MIRPSLRWLVLAFAGASAACTVPAGTLPDGGPCMASPSFFAQEIWPRYLDHNSCERSSCHAASDGSGYFRLEPAPGAPPSGTLDGWPDNWRQNYLQSIQLLDCAMPLDSLLLTTPAGLADVHPPGPSVDNLDEARQLFQEWVTAP